MDAFAGAKGRELALRQVWMQLHLVHDGAHAAVGQDLLQVGLRKVGNANVAHLASVHQGLVVQRDPVGPHGR